MQTLVMGADTAGWIGAIAAGAAAVGTVAALFAALWQIRRERQAREALEDRIEQTARREQATKVSGWIGRPDPPGTGWQRQRIELLNESNEPVYRAVVYCVSIQGAGPKTGRAIEGRSIEAHQFRSPEIFRSLLSVIPPDRHYTKVTGSGGQIPIREQGVELAFTDRAGVDWLRAADGRLPRSISHRRTTTASPPHSTGNAREQLELPVRPPGGLSHVESHAA